MELAVAGRFHVDIVVVAKLLKEPGADVGESALAEDGEGERIGALEFVVLGEGQGVSGGRHCCAFV